MLKGASWSLAWGWNCSLLLSAVCCSNLLSAHNFRLQVNVELMKQNINTIEWISNFLLLIYSQLILSPFHRARILPKPASRPSSYRQLIPMALKFEDLVDVASRSEDQLPCQKLMSYYKPSLVRHCSSDLVIPSRWLTGQRPIVTRSYATALRLLGLVRGPLSVSHILRFWNIT